MACRLQLVVVFCWLFSFLLLEVECLQWPVPYARHKSRPPSNPYCQAGFYPFCEPGYSDGHIPVMASNDTIEVFIMKAPVWEFKFGDLLGKFNIMHDAIGFRSQMTKKNYTTEWYELFQLFNCTFPHIVDKRTLWCNQGAACFYPGINDTHWTANGTLKKVAEMTGEQFNQLADHIHWDNNTGLFYETWRVRNSTGTDYVQDWFLPYDCANYVIRMFQYMGAELGVKFISGYQVNYTFITLYSDMPVFLGNDSDIFGTPGNATLAVALIDFYSNFQAHQPIPYFLESLVHIVDYVYLKKEFYLYYNSEYWLLHLKDPYVKITYDPVPFVN